MLAAVTGPLLAVDVHALQQSDPDFSTQADPARSATTDTLGSASPQSLETLVADHLDDSTATEEERCLATSVYYESKGEPLPGQLAVAQTILNRSKSGRFPDSVCGVVRQPGQFSFLRGGDLPSPPQASSAWQRAVAIAKVAREGLWKQIAPAALYFHARRVSPGWGKVRIASIGNHIFFR
ncbi:cell wall hydrolase [Sphingomonas morindae]|uniref:Cell wall hydrolase n=1 Tax=Sphingomonas morindae TaxID=1541170 RepID=A0ABY4XBB8_9SPHN|nr:cell wall hydrolase [Sphingomonas morindae]USI74247.1 cell wall hydrolase [Sphingomonas morindae]